MNSISITVISFCLMFLEAGTPSLQIWEVLSSFPEVSKPTEMMKNYLNNQALDILEKIKGKEDYIPKAESFNDWKEKRRQILWDLLGGKPEQTPLNPVVVKKGEKEKYRYEVLYFESMPGLYVSAVLYLPLTSPPYPAMIIPCGHSREGKGYIEYQKMCVLLAQNGIASLMYDPPGQGERITFVDEKNEPMIWGTAEHTAVGTRCILLGTNYALFEIWDGIRAVDYLMSRDDIDVSKIGCAGNSGGGTQTAYLMALDDRIGFSAPSCYITSWEKLLVTIGPQDAEQNIFSQIAYGFDHSDYLMLHAPKPFLLCCATYDFFDINGTWDSYRRAKRMYSELGISGKCDIIEVERKHGWCKEMREEITRKALIWLCGKLNEVHENIDDSEVLTKNEYQVTTSGNVRDIANCVSIPEILKNKLAKIERERDEKWVNLSREERKEKVAQVISIANLGMFSEPTVRELSEDIKDRLNISGVGKVRKLLLMPEEGIFIPMVIFEPQDRITGIVLLTPSKGKGVIDLEEVQKYLSEGKCVVGVDLRGIGETSVEGNKNDITATSGAGWIDYFRAYLLGKSFVGMWVEDYFSIWKFLEKEYGKEVECTLIADEKLCIPAVHFAYLLDSPRLKLKLNNLYFWKDLIVNYRAKGQILTAVNGVLLWYDIPHLIADIGENRVEFSKAELPVF